MKTIWSRILLSIAFMLVVTPLSLAMKKGAVSKPAPLVVTDSSLQKSLHLVVRFFGKADFSAAGLRLLLAEEAAKNKISLKKFVNEKYLDFASEQEYSALFAGIPLHLVSNFTCLIHRAIASGKVEALQTLLASGAKLEASNSLGFTPLFTAIDCHSYPQVQLLLAHKADPLALHPSLKITTVALAFARSSAEGESSEDFFILKELLAAFDLAKSKTVFENYTYGSCLRNSQLTNYVYFCMQLEEALAKNDKISYVPTKSFDYNGNTPLHVLAEIGELTLIPITYKNSPKSMQQYNDNGDYPLHTAIKEALALQQRFGIIPERYLRSISALLACNPEGIAWTTRSGLSPLHLACRGKSLILMNHLISHGGDPEAAITPGDGTSIALSPRRMAQAAGLEGEMNLFIAHLQGRRQCISEARAQLVATWDQEDADFDALQARARDKHATLLELAPHADFLMAELAHDHQQLAALADELVASLPVHHDVCAQAPSPLVSMIPVVHEQLSDDAHLAAETISETSPLPAKKYRKEPRRPNIAQASLITENAELEAPQELDRESQPSEATNKEKRIAKRLKKEAKQEEKERRIDAQLQTLQREVAEGFAEELAAIDREKAEHESFTNDLVMEIHQQAVARGIVANILISVIASNQELELICWVLNKFPATLQLVNTPASFPRRDGSKRRISPLALAISKGDHQLVELLLAKGASTKSASQTLDNAEYLQPLAIAQRGAAPHKLIIEALEQGMASQAD